MKRSLHVGLCLVIAACATEPRAPESFDGTVTQIFVVSGAFGGGSDYTFTVNQNPSYFDPANPCLYKASVHVSASTSITRSDAPSVQVGPDQVGGMVQVKPAERTGATCLIEATSIVIVKEP